MCKLTTYTLIVVAMLLGFATNSLAQETEYERKPVKVIPVNRPEFAAMADFTTYFDNKEYASIDNSLSETLFSARLTPKISLDWRSTPEGGDYGFRAHSLVFGVDMFQDFGHNSKFLSDVKVQMYYNFSTPSVDIFAGIFPRSKMFGMRSTLFFDRDYRYYNNRIQGLLMRYGGGEEWKSFIELAMDYDGMRSFDRRESFMIMSSGRWVRPIPHLGLTFGYDFLMGHYAKDYNPETADGVVDNLMFTPVVRFDHTFRWGGEGLPLTIGAEARYILSLQRDRLMENTWQAPMGGELMVELEFWYIDLRNRLYLGQNLLTHYGRYGSSLYHGSPLYATTEGIYNTIEIGCNSHFSNFVDLEVGVMIDYDGRGWGTRQYIALNIELWPIKFKK